MTRRAIPPFARAAGTAALVAIVAACVETRRVEERPWFAGLEGATRGGQPMEAPPPPSGAARTDEPASASSLVVTNPDGSRTLISRNPRHLIRHIRATLNDNEEELFVEQVLCEVTRREFLERGYHPREGFVYLQSTLPELERLFAQMPLGEATPGLLMEKLGRNEFRLRVSGPAARDLTWDGMDMVVERGLWRLRWFTTRPGLNAGQ